MFCPKCGTQNGDSNKYCRGCRENLQLVSQAMKSHLPVVIASKVDQILDSRSERFRRDSVLSLLMSLTILLGGFVSWQKGNSEPYIESLFLMLLALICAYDAFREYRAYKRSLSPDFNWTGSKEKGRDNLTPGGNRFDTRNLSPDFDWRGTGQEDYRNILTYPVGRAVRMVYRSLKNSVRGGSVISRGSVQFARGDNEPNNKTASARYFADAFPPTLTESTTRELSPLGPTFQREPRSEAAPDRYLLRACPPSVAESTTRQLDLMTTGCKETGEQGTSAKYSVDPSPPSVTESTTRQLDLSGTHPKEQPRMIYCPICGRAGERPAICCSVCGADLGLIASALEFRKQNRRTAKLDRFIRRKNNGLATASQNFTPYFWPAYAIYFGITQMSGWWIFVLTGVVSFVQGSWDRIVYRRNPSDQEPTVQSTDAPLRIVDASPRAIDADWEVFSPDGRVLRINDAPPATIDAAESRPICEWQRLYPDLWLLIEVTSEDEGGVSEGKLVATAEDRSAFRELDDSYDERYLVAIYGRP